MLVYFATYGLLFQSTLPVRGATAICIQFARPEVISIHAPREGSDTKFPANFTNLEDFNPRSP